MPRKKNPDIVREESYKDELENMLEDIDDILDQDKKDDKLLPTNKKGCFMDFEKIKSEADERSKEVVRSIVDFYLDARMFGTEEAHRFLKSKMEMDELTISTLIYQMRTAEHAITKLLEEIDSGNMHPRQFEVLGGLQKSKMEIVKHLAFVQIQMENNYKIIRQEYDNLYQDDKDSEGNNVQVGGIGTKGLLQEMRKKMVEKELTPVLTLENNSDYDE